MMTPSPGKRPRPGDETVEFAVVGMHCTSCGMLIDDFLEDVSGVIESHTEFRKSRATVRYDPSLVSVEQLAAAIQTAGYRADLGSSDPAANTDKQRWFRRR